MFRSIDRSARSRPRRVIASSRSSTRHGDARSRIVHRDARTERASDPTPTAPMIARAPTLAATRGATTRAATRRGEGAGRARGAATRRGATNDADAKTTTATTTTTARRTFVLDGARGAIAMAMVTARAEDARALLQPNDEEDEAFLAKARENRAQRIQSEVAKEKKYVNDTGYKQDEPTAKVQLAVYKLSKSGAQIASGNLSDAASELGKGDWVTYAVDGAKALNASSDGSDFASSVKALEKACENGDDAAAKSAYRASAEALKALAASAGVADKLRLL